MYKDRQMFLIGQFKYFPDGLAGQIKAVHGRKKSHTTKRLLIHRLLEILDGR